MGLAPAEGKGQIPARQAPQSCLEITLKAPQFAGEKAGTGVIIITSARAEGYQLYVEYQVPVHNLIPFQVIGAKMPYLSF